MRYKSWPYYDAWKEIYGNDRATGDGVEDLFNAYCDFQSNGQTTENVDLGIDEDVSPQDLPENEGIVESYTNTKRRGHVPVTTNKKHKAADVISGVCDILVEIGRKVDERLASLEDSLGYEARLGKALEDLFEQLGSITNLSKEERFEVCAILGTQPDKLKIFKGMPTSARPDYVEWLLTKFHV